MSNSRRNKASWYAAGVAACLFIGSALGAYGLTQKHQSTISSLRSELSNKDQVIEKKDNLIKEQNASILKQNVQLDQYQEEVQQQKAKLDTRQSIINQSAKDLNLSREKIEDQSKTIDSLEDKVSYAKPTPNVVNVASKKATKLVYQKGWIATYYRISGKTASGKQTKDGVTIAVDPRYIPLGTWVEIKMPNGKVIKRRADDTGRLIKGKKIDIYVNKSQKQTLQLGKHGIQVRILGKKDTY